MGVGVLGIGGLLPRYRWTRWQRVGFVAVRRNVVRPKVWQLRTTVHSDAAAAEAGQGQDDRLDGGVAVQVALGLRRLGASASVGARSAVMGCVITSHLHNMKSNAAEQQQDAAESQAGREREETGERRQRNREAAKVR